VDRDALKQEAEWRRCRGKSPSDWEACLYFLQTYWKIKHPERGRILFELREAQQETLQAWLTNRYNIVLKARQIGYSTLAAAIAFWLVFFWGDKLVIMLSRGEREASKLLGKSTYGFRYLPDWMKLRGPSPTSNTLSKLTFDNESGIESLPSTQDPARGEAAYLVIVDEWAFLENPEEAWSSIEPVADVGGRVIGLSTANGSGNFFHLFWQAAQEVRNRFVPLFYPWSANTDRDESWYDDKKEDLSATPWILHQEYPRTAEEAFVKSGRTVFDTDFLDTLAKVTPTQGILWAQSRESRYAEYRLRDDGELSLFEPPRTDEVYVIGADVAEGLEHGDFSSAHVLDVRNNAVVAHWHGRIAPDLFGEQLFRLGLYYNAALTGVESNNHGLTTLVAMQNLRYPNIYYRTTLDQRTNVRSRKMGWRTQVNTKPYLIDQLATSLRDGLVVRDAKTLSELRLYVREPDGKTLHGSPFDDRVISLAIAVEMLNFAHAPEYKVESNDYGTLAWWVRTIDPEPKNMMIGAGSMRTRHPS
jgi:hypothetical protein